MSCGANKFYTQVNKNRKFATKVYNNYLKSFGNVSMIDPEGNFSVIWYYANNKINVTNIARSKIVSVRDYNCDSILNIDKYQYGCYPEAIDGDGFQSSYYDAERDSLCEIWIGLDVDKLKSNETDCPFIKDLRNHIIKYNLY